MEGCHLRYSCPADNRLPRLARGRTARLHRRYGRLANILSQADNLGGRHRRGARHPGPHPRATHPDRTCPTGRGSPGRSFRVNIGCLHQQPAMFRRRMGNGVRPQASIRESKSSIRPGSAECSNALRLGATYCASSANIRARNSTGFFLLRAMRAIPVIGSQRSAASLR